jgi:hypothetical protein
MGDGVCVPAVAWLTEHLLTPLVSNRGAGAPALTADAAPLLARTQQRADRWFRDRP